MVDWVAIISYYIIVIIPTLICQQLPILIQPHKQHLETIINFRSKPIIMQLQYNLKIDMFNTLLSQVNRVFNQLFNKLEKLLFLELISRV